MRLKSCSEISGMVRIAYALGGLGSGIVNNKEELVEKAKRAFSFTKQILIE
jgi:carbamoyl-phosphate synthase large subunit